MPKSNQQNGKKDFADYESELKISACLRAWKFRV